MNNYTIIIVVIFGFTLFFPTIVYSKALIGVEEISNQSFLQNQTAKEEEQKKIFENMSKDANKILGIVENEIFFPLDTKSPVILTSVMMQEARNPEAGIIDLHQYEGQNVLVSYQHSDDELFGAGLVDSICFKQNMVLYKTSFICWEL